MRDEGVRVRRIAFIVILAWIALLAGPEIDFSGSTLPCPTLTAQSVPSLLVGRAAASPCPGQEWSVVYETATENHAVSVQPTSDGGHIAALGFTFGILKLGPDGAVEWSKTYSD